MDLTKLYDELAGADRFVNSPELIRFAKDAAAAAEQVNKMITPNLKAIQDAEEFLRAAEKASARLAEWQQRQQRLLLSFQRRSQGRPPLKELHDRPTRGDAADRLSLATPIQQGWTIWEDRWTDVTAEGRNRD